MIILALTISLVNQMPDTWKGLYTWLRENYPEVHLVTWDIDGNIVFEGQIKVYLNDGAQVVFFNVKSEFTIVNIIIEEMAVELGSPGNIELCKPYSIDEIWTVLQGI